MKKLVISTLLVMQVLFGFAQTLTGVTGKVVDSKTQKPLANVVVSILNTPLTELTDATGKFTFKEVAEGNQLVQIKTQGYEDQMIQAEVTAGKMLDLGTISATEDVTQEQQLSLITITENDLGDDNSGSESTSGLLQASRDAFQQAAAFNWGQARFRMRGLDNEYGTTMINGLAMNKIYDGRPQWSNWGGLNDATRNQEFTVGSGPSDYTFGGILGTQEINTRASIYRKGSRVSFSGTNTNYSWRMMGTHASGMNTNGWAFVVSAGRRWAEEGYFDGTDYSANSVFASVEKKFNDKHSLNFTSIYAQNRRGKTSPNTDEVTDLKDYKYNSYWGWQDDKKRNARVKDIEEPINMLTHYWKMSDKTNLATTVAFQTGYVGNSRIDYQLANNPDPTYYKYLPSYHLKLQSAWDQTGVDQQGNPIYTNQDAIDAQNQFVNDGQVNWNAMYYTNQVVNQGGRAAYALYEDRTEDKQWSANSILNSTLSDNIVLNAAVNFKKLNSRNYQKMLDLLGGSYFLDIDTFYTGDASQSDLNHPDRQVKVGDAYGYDYDLNATVIDGFTQFKFNYKKVDFYLGQSFTRTQYQRDGNYKNGIYASNSYGRSEKVNFENFGFKGGLTYKITGRQMLDFNGAYMTKAPTIRNTFSNSRINNNITPNLNSERIMSVDASYIIKTPKFKGRLTGYYSKIMNANEVAFFYGEGLFDEAVVGQGNEDSFISEIVTGINKRQMGAELGFEWQLTSTIKATGAAAYGEYIIDNNPNLKVNDDAQASSSNTNPIFDFGRTYLKNYHQAGMPQQAYSFGLEYRDPKFWWIGANVNYLADAYIDVSSILRTNNFTISNGNSTFDGVTDSELKRVLKQEKFDPITLVNLVGGKSWKIKNDTFGFFASVNNVFDIVYKTGGFEQSRKATYPDYIADNASQVLLNNSPTSGAIQLDGPQPSFAPKYFYGYGRTYFVNFYINF